MIPLLELQPGNGVAPTLHLYHANGLPPETYKVLVNALDDDLKVVALYARPMWNPRPSPDSFVSWEIMADDLLHGLDEHGIDTVIGVGHSMGGTSTMLASIKQPERFAAIILLDPVLMPRRYLWLLKVLQSTIGYKIPLVEMALKRRRNWESAEAAFQRYQGRAIFEKWPDQALRDYIDGVTRFQENTASELELIYPPEWEAKIYETMPLDVWQHVPKITVPTLVICGADSDTFRPLSAQLWRKLRPDINVISIPDATHFVPVEQVEAVSSAMGEFIRGLNLEKE
jgi:pimeloyl-ACP methyl ester carboxylesterase